MYNEITIYIWKQKIYYKRIKKEPFKLLEDILNVLKRLKLSYNNKMNDSVNLVIKKVYVCLTLLFTKYPLITSRIADGQQSIL